PHRDVRREIDAEKIEVVERPFAGRRRIDEREPDDRGEHQQAARLREDEELDRGIHPVLVPPDRDQEIHRHEHDFPQEKEEEEVERDKDPDDSGDRPEEIRVKEADPLRDLGPRAGYGHEAEEKGQRDHQEAQSVHREMEADTEAGNPRPLGLDQPAGAGRLRDRGGVQPDRGDEHEIDGDREQRDPAHEARALLLGDPREHARDERNDDEPSKDHRSKVTAITTTTPASMPAAYHLSSPVWLSAAPRHAARSDAAIPS